MHVNRRGFRSKEESILEAANKLDTDVITMNETNLIGNNKLVLESYLSFVRNRKKWCKDGGHFNFHKSGIKG